MVRRIGWLLLAVGLTSSALAATKSGSISGYVRSAGGTPQMGALVEVLGSAYDSFRGFTDAKGFYSVSGLVPGTYNVKVSAPTFLSQLKERVGLRAGGTVTLNVTLTTLFDALQLVPAAAGGEEDDWKWVLRSTANRPILRVLDDGTLTLASEQTSHDLKGAVSFLAGSGSAGFGNSSDMTTGFRVERSLFSSGTLDLQGNLGYGDGLPSTVLRASYQHPLANGSTPKFAVTVRSLPSPSLDGRNAVQALSLTTSDNVVLGNVLELRFGSELQTIQFMGRLNAFRPFGSADLHLSPDTVLEYAYATSKPDGRAEKGFDSAPADLSESGPRVSMAGYASSVEKGQHQELSLSRRLGKNRIQLAAYTDHIKDPALSGVGNVSSENGYALPDFYSESFTYQGHDLDAHGFRVVAQRTVNSNLTATFTYEYGGALALDDANSTLQDAADRMVLRNRHSVSAKASGTIPVSKTRWIASYRWTGGPGLTPVDQFNSSPGQADPFLNVFLRQPIPGTSFLPVRMVAVLDLRNLLAQGYVPVMAQDGQTVYLVQSARAVRGGLAFTF